MSAKDAPTSSANDDDILDFAEDHEPKSDAAVGLKPWRVLIVDDDHEVHAATRFALARRDVTGRALDLISAYSAAEGRALLQQNPDVAVVLLDVVMEEPDAGLKFVEWMRASGFKKQRIILRTGQPGYAPEIDVINNYDINDYRAKAELTQTRLITAITTAIRTFEQFCLVENQRVDLQSFAYALAHDFKQTTRQIQTYSGMLLRRFDGDVSSEAPRMLNYLSGAARRLGALVDVMSQYTLLCTPPDLEAVDIEKVFADVRASLETVLQETGGVLIVEGRGTCQGNAALITQVLQILSANGLQNNDSSEPRVELSAAIEDEHCVISARDNGMGMTPDEIARIFKPEARPPAATDMPEASLGLTMCWRAIESQGGEFWCQSEPGAGSVFHVRLAIADDAAPMPPDRRAA